MATINLNRALTSYCALTLLVFGSFLASAEQTPSKRLPLIDDSGTYSRPISTTEPQSQAYFDQGLRFAWGFYFPEAIASYQVASQLDPTHPMPSY